MGKLSLLDCTLRDGGYQNEWRFGFDNIKKIAGLLAEAKIDIVELGFITDRVEYDRDCTKFNTIEQLSDIIPADRKDELYVAMLNYGELDIKKLPPCNSKINGLRVAFHKSDIDGALAACESIKAKGYFVFLQAMGAQAYSDTEFLKLIERVNVIEPYAFYIVDSFGSMKKGDLLRLFYLARNNVELSTCLGFHSHNNLQLAYSNAITLLEQHCEHNLIFDASVYGMGRGAGNLNLELFAEHLNSDYGTGYVILKLLTIVDEVLNGFYKQNYWGYSLSNYISAKYGTHPNYATFLDDKNTLRFEDINDIIAMMSDTMRDNFNKAYIEKLYVDYLSRGKTDAGSLSHFGNKVGGNEVLLVCPGASISEFEFEIMECAKTAVTISVNFDYPIADFTFISNIRRFKLLKEGTLAKVIVTTNIPTTKAFLRVDYASLLLDEEMVEDNAVLMLIKLLQRFDVKKIWLAGLDGYSHDSEKNYGDKRLEIITKKAIADTMNIGMSKVLSYFAAQMDIAFLTKPQFVRIKRGW